VREYQDLHTTICLDPEISSTAVVRSESLFDASTSDYHLEAPAVEHADLELTLSRSVMSDCNVPYVTANPISTARNQGIAASNRFLQSASPPLSWNCQSDQENALLVSTFASSFPLNQTCSLVTPSDTDVELPVSRTEQTRLIRAYLQETGTWCEATDSDRHFTVSRVHKLMENKPFAAAAMALSSRQLDALSHSQRQSTLYTYQHAVQSLLHYEPSQCGEATLATCVLLSVYEMMASDVSEWRRHLKVCY
jgi:hypothetical protein